MLKNKYAATILTASDKCYAGEREDLSTPTAKEVLTAWGYAVLSCIILPDDQNILEEQLCNICDGNTVNLLITTGGTGLSPRDCMPEATLAVAQRLVPGIAEAMRTHSIKITQRAMLSRAVSAIRANTLIINLPGSPKAVKENLEYIIPQLEHALDILTIESLDCAKK